MATATYKCPNCGGGLKFEPDIQKSRCEFCRSVFTDAELGDLSKAIDEKAQREADRESGRLKGYNCDSCGAEVVTEETTSATFCYYCHNPVLLTERLTGDFKPTKIVPFSYDKEKAIAAFLKWARKRMFVPKTFYSNSQLEKITGMYIPYWMANVQADVDYAGKGTNLRTWRVGDTEYTEHKEFAIARQGLIDINNVHEVAMRKIDKGLIDSISPYDETKTLDFSMSYLSGFFAEKYDIQKDEVQPLLESKAREYAKIMVNEAIGSYDSVQLVRDRLDLVFKGWNYALLPAWILTYLYKGKTYIYAINGQTGKAHGELPVDNKKLSLTSVAIAAGVLALAILGGLLIW
jgi:DNA-directed RNA polymerase subunit RPC12/RpoP